MSALKNNKEQKQIAVSKAILEIIEKDGLLGVTHSKISRKSKVSRAWIYEYVGKEKTSLVHFAAEELASNFARVEFDLPKNKQELQKNLEEAVQFLFEEVEQNPGLIKLYFRFRGTKNPIGDVIKKYEKQWLDGATKVISSLMHLPKEEASLMAEVIMTLRLGFAHRFVTSAKPKESKERTEKIFKLLHQFFPESI